MKSLNFIQFFVSELLEMILIVATKLVTAAGDFPT